MVVPLTQRGSRRARGESALAVCDRSGVVPGRTLWAPQAPGGAAPRPRRARRAPCGAGGAPKGARHPATS